MANDYASNDVGVVERRQSSRRIFARKTALLLGRRTLAWLVASVVAGLVLAGVEVGVSIFLQLFMKSLGLVTVDVHVPFLRWRPGPVGLAVGLGMIGLVRSTAQFLVAQSATEAMEGVNARLRRMAIWDMLLNPARRGMPASEVNARAGDLASKSSLFCYGAAALLGSLVQNLALAVAMFLTGAGETVIALLGLGCVGLVVLRLNRFARAATAHVPAELRVLTDGIERVARNATLVRVLRTQDVEHRRLSSAIDRYARHLIRAGYLGNFAMAMTPFAGILLIVLIIVISQRGLHTPGATLLSFLYLFVRFVQSLATATSQFSNCSATWPMFKDSLDYVSGFATPNVDAAMRLGMDGRERSASREPSEGGEPPPISVRSVGFAYEAGSGTVLRDLTLEIAAGSQLAVVGPSGSGKSTLLAIMLGLIEPSSGEIRIGGESPSAYFSRTDVRVGYVGAEAFLIAGTIRENLRYGLAVDAGDEDLHRALEHARLRETIEGLRGGLDYRIGEDGSGLSAGQKQRLCLARALLNRPHVLVLDEASANLDAETEGQIAETLRELSGSCTMIVVSHRAGILKHANYTVSLGQAA